ncbi:acyltransferase family protein [Massilia sp. S19_KUP03_FR1]|uniref:acyltransferase family protein n=1 Tax=Massilia sp. S19_KUP03_FR1 TaxID=3025503 RepID=UPI002FCDCEC7
MRLFLLRFSKFFSFSTGRARKDGVLGRTDVAPSALTLAAAQPWRYCSDIDGLRALAVCAVLIFHAFPKALPGGFAGVDIFFVISGFLITAILARDAAHGGVSLARFYSRRARRIFPSLALVLAATHGLGWFVMHAAEFKQLGKHIWAGAAFVSNWVAWNEAGYFDRDAASKPLLHLWSLAIEEQFYLVWPLVLTLALRWRRAAVTLCAAMLVLSFGANVWLVREHAAATFFLPATRFWELLAGAMLALAPAARPTPGRNADTLSIAGLALCFLSFLLLRPEFAFPGWWALLPVLGACAVLAAGPQSWAGRTLLAHPLAVWVGGISYPLYLWHWPLLSLTVIVAGAQPVPAWVRCAILGASVLLAWLTTTAIEARFRFGPPRMARLVVPCLALLSIGFVGSRVYERDGFSFRRGSDAHADVATASLGQGREFVRQECAVVSQTHPGLCATDLRTPPHFAVWGDSKAEALFWGLVRRSAPNQGWMLLGQRGCAPMSGVERTSAFLRDRPQDCAQANRAILQALISERSIHTVLLAFTDRDMIGPRFAYSSPRENMDPTADDKVLVLAGVEQAVTALEQAGKLVGVVLDNPRLPDPERCMDRAVLAWPGVRTALALGTRSSAPRCDLPYADYLKQRQALDQLIMQIKHRHPQMIVYDPGPVLCDQSTRRCPMTMDGKYLYSYGDHVSDFANGRMADALLPLLPD